MRDLMLAVALAACVLLGLRAFPILWIPLALVGPEGLAALSAWFLPAHSGSRRFARTAIAVLLWSNLRLIAQSIYLTSTYLRILPYITICISTAMIACALLAWKSSTWKRPGGSDGLSLRARVCIVVLGLTLLSLIVHDWPMPLAFKLSQPALERLADQVERGGNVARPMLAGAFLIVASAVDPVSGNVALITNNTSSGRSGLVRQGLSSSQTFGPLYNHNMDVWLDPRWRLQEED